MAKWTVPIISQRTLSLCWEACGHMLWNWRYKSAEMRKRYTQKAGNYTKLNKGLQEQEMDKFYSRLGIRSLRNPKGRNVRHALKWTPVIVTSVGQGRGHAFVVAGHGSGKYTVVNPCFRQVVDFTNPNGDSCIAERNIMTEAAVDKMLGDYIWYW